MEVTLLGLRGLFPWAPLPPSRWIWLCLGPAPPMGGAGGHLSTVLFKKFLCHKNCLLPWPYKVPEILARLSSRSNANKLTHLSLQKSPGLSLLVNIWIKVLLLDSQCLHL